VPSWAYLRTVAAGDANLTERWHRRLRRLRRRPPARRRAQPEFDLWDRRISTHPDHLAEEARKLAEWEARERPYLVRALEQLRKLVPPGILRTNKVDCHHCRARSFHGAARPSIASDVDTPAGCRPKDKLVCILSGARRSQAALESAGMPHALAKRLWEKRVLWFVRMQPKAIAKLHFADLSTSTLLSLTVDHFQRLVCACLDSLSACRSQVATD
jgi:hypothetical protein